MASLQDELSRLETRLDPTRASVIGELAKVRDDLSCRAPDAPVRLANLRIASPCKERWADMVGDDRVRVCNGCERPVFDLSQMTNAEAEAVLATRGVKPCVRFYRRADGTIMTADCAPGARRKVRIATVAAGAVLAAASPAMAEPVDPIVIAAPDATGSIQGVVKDKATGEVVIGATVVVTSAAITMQTAITDETGSYQLTSLPPGADYVVTFYYNDLTVERTGIAVDAGKTTPVLMTLDTSTAGETIHIDNIMMGVPPEDSTYEMGDIIETTPRDRPVIEWSSWARLGVGTASEASAGVARSITRPPRTDRRTVVEAALGAELTLPIAMRGDLRVGAWTEVRTSSGPVVGGELQVEGVPRRLDLFQYDGEGILSIRAGGNGHVVTGAIAFGYLAPWKLWGPWDGATRYMIGVRLVASATRSLDDPRDWTATGGLEFEPVGALRYLLGIHSWY